MCCEACSDTWRVRNPGGKICDTIPLLDLEGMPDEQASSCGMAQRQKEGVNGLGKEQIQTRMGVGLIAQAHPKSYPPSCLEAQHEAVRLVPVILLA